MKYQVEGKYKDDGKCHFYLNADQAFNYTTWRAPILWKGFVDSQEVEFIQTDAGAYDLSCFDWTGFPSELEAAKQHIIKAIDDAMRVMD